MRVVGYIRVSTDKQAERGMSLEVQEAKLRQYAGLYDLEMVSLEVEAGVSAKRLTSQREPRFDAVCERRRPALFRALSHIREGKAEGILVAKLDRLTRSVVDMGQLIEQYFRQWALMSVSDQVDTRTAAGRMVLNILTTVSEWERDTISERTSEALQYRKAQGLPYCRGPVVDPAVVAQLREWRAAGLSYRAIAHAAQAAGMAPCWGRQWHPNVVRRMVLRAAPTGERRIA